MGKRSGALLRSNSKAFNGALTTLDVISNTIDVTIDDAKIKKTAQADAARFTVSRSGNGYAIQAASGLYIGQSSNANGLVSSNTALVNSIFMPLLSLITGKVDFNAMKWTIKSGTATKLLEDGSSVVEPHYTDIPYGTFLQAIFVFVFTALCLFLVIKALNKVMNLKKKGKNLLILRLLSCLHVARPLLIQN